MALRRIWRRFAALVLLVALALTPEMAMAQDGPAAPPAGTAAKAQVAPDYVRWERVAAHAEDVLDADRAEIPALEALRDDLAGWRSQFQAAQRAGDSRITALRAQIEALGPAPAEGQTESEDVAVRRADLNAQLSDLEAPRRAAGEAWSRADSLIGQIDSRIRGRQADELVRLGPTPLNPRLWPEAARAIGGFVFGMGEELLTNVRDDARMSDALQKLPPTLVILLLGFLLLLRSRYWTLRLRRWVAGRVRPAAAEVAGFVISLLRWLLPVLGGLLIVIGLDRSGLLGARGLVFVQTLPLLALVVFGASWLGEQVFPRSETGNEVLNLPPERRVEGRFFAGLLGFALWLVLVVRTVSKAQDWSVGTLAVAQFPAIVIIGLCLVRLGRIIGRRIEPAEGESEHWAFRRQLAHVVGRAVILLGFAGPVLAAIGYVAAASFLTIPTTMTLALLATLVLLQHVLTQLYALITRSTEREVDDSLPPVLIGLTLTVLSLPVFALVWGARTADLTEIWGRFHAGFTIGTTRISPGQFLTFLIVFGVGYGVTRILQGTMRSAVLPKTRIDLGGQNALIAGIGYVGIFLAALAAITAAGVDLSALAIVFGALSVGIGFGLQNIVQNFISGIIMLIERPVAEGDWVEVGGKAGIVRAISVRSTRIETFDRTDVIVPNGEFITGIVTNWTRHNLTGRIIVTVGVAYGTDTRKVEAILREIAEAHPMVTMSPPPAVIFAGFGADSLNFEIRAILRDVNFSLAAKSDIHHEIARRFAEEGIEIPFAQRDIWLRNPETLPARAVSVAAPSETPPAPDQDGADPEEPPS